MVGIKNPLKQESSVWIGLDSCPSNHTKLSKITDFQKCTMSLRFTN